MTDFQTPVVLFTNSPAMGGMEQHVLLLAQGLVERRVRTAVVCSPRPEIAPLRDELTELGAAVYTPPDRRDAFGAGRRVRELADHFRQYPRGILHVHSTGFHGGDLVMLAGRWARMAAIVRTEHVPPQPPVGLRHRLQVRARDRLLVAKVICVSAGNRQEHIDVLGRSADKLTVVPNGIDVERFAATHPADLRAELGLPADVQIVGVVARLAEARKGTEEFLRAAASVARDRCDVHFVLVGDGPLRPSLEQLANELGLGGRATFLGTRDDAAQLMAAMDTFVMPSLWEAGPLTVLEAMALGKPVVTTPVGVVPDIVTDEHNGLIVQAGDVDALAAAISRLLSDRQLAARLGKVAADDARRSFTAGEMVDRTIRVYESVTDRP